MSVWSAREHVQPGTDHRVGPDAIGTVCIRRCACSSHVASNTCPFAHCADRTLLLCAAPGEALDLKGLIPYWMSRDEAVANDVLLRDEMVALSGPNMGGKSTFLRALVAAALLANCGLPVPAAAGACVPEVRLLACWRVAP